jgi:hypothetical protein
MVTWRQLKKKQAYITETNLNTGNSLIDYITMTTKPKVDIQSDELLLQLLLLASAPN